MINLLNDAGFRIDVDERSYIPRLNDKEIESKIMKPQNIPKLVELGSHDVGFTGYDWIVETKADVFEIMDLGFDVVKIIAAVPEHLLGEKIFNRRLVVASEYENIATNFLDEGHYDYILIRTYGATEVFPPEDADMIIDNMSTGRTLKEHNLHVIQKIMDSSTRFIANRAALEDPWKHEKIKEMEMLFKSVLDARGKVMLEMNVPKEVFEAVINVLPCMRSPTISPLYGETGYAVKVAVDRDQVIKLIPLLRKLGATDILEYEFKKVVL